MKLTDENGEEYEEIKILGEYICTHEECQKMHGMMVVRKREKPENPMPELKPGLIVRRRELNSGQKPEVIIIQEVNEPGLFTGINISRGWNRECFCQQQVIEVCYPRTIDVIWSREP